MQHKVVFISWAYVDERVELLDRLAQEVQELGGRLERGALTDTVFVHVDAADEEEAKRLVAEAIERAMEKTRRVYERGNLNLPPLTGQRPGQQGLRLGIQNLSRRV